MKNAIVLAILAATLSLSGRSALAADPNAPSQYSGFADCGLAKSYLPVQWYYAENINCSIKLNLQPSERSPSGDVFGNFTYSASEPVGRIVYSQSGRYEISFDSQIFFNIRTWGNPQPGGSYAFGQVYGNAIDLATGAGATRLYQQR